MKRILVTGAGGSASYNYIESLRNNSEKEKFYIVGADVSKYHIELAQVDKRYIVPPISDKNYLDKINHILKEEKIDFLHIQPDPEVTFFAQHRDKIKTRVLLPDFKIITLCQNKMLFNETLHKASIAVPEAYFLSSENDLEVGLKTLFKHHEKVWLRATRGAGSRAALPVKNIEQAKMWIKYWQEMKVLGYGDFMVSEFLPGKEYAFQSFWKDGKLLMSQARERIEYIFGNLTPSGQSSSPSVAVTVHNDEVNQLGYEAIRAIDKNATGIFCIDMKTDKDGKVKVIETNAGRFFTTSLFFSMAGMNMPYFYTKMGLGEDIKIPFKKFNNIKAGMYWVRMIDMGYKLIEEKTWTSKKI